MRKKKEEGKRKEQRKGEVITNTHIFDFRITKQNY